MPKVRYHCVTRGFALPAKSQIFVLTRLKSLNSAFYLPFVLCFVWLFRFVPFAFCFLICSTLIPPNPMSLGSMDSRQTTIRSFALPYLVASSSVMSAISCSFCALSNSGFANFMLTSGIFTSFVFEICV